MNTAAESPQSTRPLAGAWLGGVCAGLADNLGWPVLAIRMLFVLLSAVALIGVGTYFALWLLMPAASASPAAPGLDAGTRRGLRPRPRGNFKPIDIWAASALLLLGVGALWLVQRTPWALEEWALESGLLAGFGTGLIWRQVDRINETLLRKPVRRRWWTALLTHWWSLLLVLVGVLALAGAVGVVVIAHPQFSETGRITLLLGMSLAGVVLAGLPWWVSARRALGRARDDALLAWARADMAAHLHDSVLQTLALIQRQAHDPKAVVNLARRQERELRQWLYTEASGSGTLAQALGEEALDVEHRHQVEIELVSVGDTELTPELVALVRAAREAMVNAAKHARADRVDVYLEVDDELVSVFVRDRGAGFDPERIDPTRMGVRGSIIERMERAGGRAVIRSAPAEGTEVRLELPR